MPSIILSSLVEGIAEQLFCCSVERIVVAWRMNLCRVDGNSSQTNKCVSLLVVASVSIG